MAQSDGLNESSASAKQVKVINQQWLISTKIKAIILK
jgi:hypothetical protein